MKTIPIQNSDRVVLVDDWWYEALVKFGPWYLDGKGTPCNKGWHKMHYLIKGRPEGTEIDHIDRNQLNNQENNLRTCTHSQNMANGSLRKSNTSGYRGVTFHKQTGKWRAYLKKEGKQISLGMFITPEEAARAHDDGAKVHFGEFASLNFP